jgi:hypothetical protein
MILSRTPNLLVLTNSEKQAMIFPLDGWPAETPSSLSLHYASGGIDVYDQDNIIVGIIPIEARSKLASSESFYVARSAATVMSDHAEVNLSWKRDDV